MSVYRWWSTRSRLAVVLLTCTGKEDYSWSPSPPRPAIVHCFSLRHHTVTMSSPPASDRPTYTPDQINQFYDRISLPAEYRHVAGNASAQVANGYHEGHGYLGALTHHTLAAIPFENLSLHYFPHRSINISAPYLFEKIVANNNGRGGYCMENNAFFGTVLRSLGFNVRVSSAVGNPTQPLNEVTYSGYSHMVNLVTFPWGQQFIVDVGFGRGGPTHPMLLEHDHPSYSGDMAYQSTRLMHQPINDTTDRSQKWWVYQKTHGFEGEWQPCYCFTTAEFLPQDFEVMNLWTSTSRAS